MSVKKRLKEFIRSQGFTISSFEKDINVSNGYVNSISKGIGGEILLSILEKSPNLNINWLLTGEGEMLKNAPEPAPQESHAGADRYTALLEDKIALLEKNNALLEDKIEDLKRRLEFAEVKDKEEMSLKIKKQRKENKTIIAEKNEIIFAQSEEINALKSRHLPPDKPLRPAQKL